MPPTSLRRLAAVARPDPAADPALVRAFLLARDEAAFAELVRRHGPMVLAVCRRVLGHREDAEDAFQAAFLVLARKAGSVRGANLAGWLYAVAVRTARGVRLMRDRRLRRSQESGVRGQTEGVPADRAAEQRELEVAVDEVLAELPDHYRLPVVLCELQGRSRKDAAAELAIPEGTLSSRLAAARRTLADRLAKRGVTAPAAGLTAVLVPAAGPVAADLARAAVRAAVADGVASAVAAEAAAGVVKGLLVAKLKAGAVAVAVAVGFVGGLVVATAPGGAVAADGPEAAPAPRPVGAVLVQQLGDPDFARREAAAKELRRLGLAAGSALLAGSRDANPEVARRSRDLHAQVRGDALVTLSAKFDPAGTAEPDHPLWQRFKQVAGNDAAARKLFAAMIADPERLRLLDRAEADPSRAGAVYVAEAVRLADWSYRDHIKKIDRLAVPDAAAILFLGTYPGAADAVGEKREWHERIAVGVTDFADGKAGDLQPPLARLLAAWLPTRTRPDQAEAGLKVVEDLRLDEAVPVLRRLATDAPDRPTRARAALVLGLMGGKEKVAFLRRLAESKGAFESSDQVSVVTKGREALSVAWHFQRDGLPVPPDLQKEVNAAEWRTGTRTVADCAWAAAVYAAGGKPAELGFLWPAKVEGWGKDYSAQPYGHGFETPAARAAAYAKAAAWLDEHAADAAALVKRLRADDFAAREAAAKELRALGAKAVPALTAAAREANPEVARRAAEVLGLIRADALAAFAKSFDPAGTADYDHPVWKRFKGIAGADRPARRLFGEIIRDSERLAALDSLAATPGKAGNVYQTVVWDMDRRLQQRKAIMQRQMPWPGTTAAEVGYVLYLGTFHGSAVPHPADSGPAPDWAFGDRAVRGAYYLRPRMGLDEMTAPDPDLGTVHPAMTKLFLAWLAERDSPEAMAKGFASAETAGLDRLPVARAVVANPRLPAKARAVALPFLARLGGKADLPVFETLFADEAVVATFRLTGAIPVGSKQDGTGAVQARDYAVGLALLLHGQDPAEFGFYMTAKRWAVVNGKPDLTKYEPFHFGFMKGDDDGRPAAHKKAREWLAANAMAAPPGPPREGKVWDHFKAVVGDDKAARELFDRVMTDPKSRGLLAKAAAGDKTLYALYLARRDELNALAERRDPVQPSVSHVVTLPLEAVAGWLLLGTDRAATGDDPGGGPVRFIDTDLGAKPLADALAADSPLARPMRKLVAAWLANRGDEYSALKAGLGLALRFDLPEALPTARRVVKDYPPPKGDRAPYFAAVLRSLGMLAVGKYGAKADLPLLAPGFDDPAQVTAAIQDSRQQRPGFAIPIEGKDYTTQVGDVALGMAVRLAGGDPRALGFVWPVDARGKPAGDPFRLGNIGFKSAADRDAAHKKARAWLDEQKK